MKNHIKDISTKLNSKFFFDYDMSKNVWFAAGGKASIFCLVHNLNELEIILNEIGNYPFEIIGAGSNLLVRDKGFDGILIKLGKDFNKIKILDTSLEVGSGILDINLSKYAQRNSIKNFEFYSGIPGTVGGAIIMNAGCYGSETKDVVQGVRLINRHGELKSLSKKNLNFEYRQSSLPKDTIVISAKYNLFYGVKEEIQEKMNNIYEMRHLSQPLKSKTSGSTFKNPKDHFAAKLIEKSDCKGLQIGGAIVSNKHSNFLININNATASDIENLGLKIIERVYNKFNIKLEWEIKIIG